MVSIPRKGGAFIILASMGITFISPAVPIFLQDAAAAETLSVNVTADPSSGPAPLENVDLQADVSGTAAGPITYKFDCTSDGTWEKTITTYSETFTAVDLCNYPNPGSYNAKVLVERGKLSFEGTTSVLVSSGATLRVDISADPSEGTEPLNNVDLQADVSGTAAGPITYKFDCTSDGTWEKTITTYSETFTAVDLCSYQNVGNYTATVNVERGNISTQGTLAIWVFKQKTLFVDLTADPSSGVEPLNDVDLTAAVSGTATGPITYKFDCTSNGTWEHIITTNANPYTAIDLCDYATPGTYTAKVQVLRDNLTAQNTTPIEVQQQPIPSTLHASISASPSSGHAPLNDVDLTASVSGTATGPITYKFDCENDWVWEKTITTNDTSYTAADLCDYSSEGVYTIRVSVERDNLIVEGTGKIVVGQTADLALEVVAYPSFGEGELLDVNLTAYLSGTATGPITYKFDCTSNDTWEKTVTTDSTSYTAVDLCDYASPGVYKAKVSATRSGLTIVGTTVILVSPPK